MSNVIPQSIQGASPTQIARLSPQRHAPAQPSKNYTSTIPFDANDLPLPVPQAQAAQEALAIAPAEKLVLSTIPRNQLRYELLKIVEAISQIDDSPVGKACQKELNSHVARLDRLQSIIEGQKRF